MNKERKIKYDISIILGLYIFIVVISKLVRFTVMKETLVDQGIGQHWVNDILSFNTKFTFFESEANNLSGDAGGNSIFIFGILLYPFKFIGINNYFEMEMVVTLFWNLLFIFLLLKCKKKLSLYEMIFLLFSIVVVNIFDFTVAKEPIQFIFFLLIFMVLQSKKSINAKILLSCSIILLSVFIFRKYYIIILYFFSILYLFLYILLKYKNYKILRVLFLLVSIPLFYYLLLVVMRKIMPDYYDALFYLRNGSTNEEAATAITSFFNVKNDFGLTIEFFVVFLRLLFPLELVALGPKYYLYIIFQLFISVEVVKAVLNYSKLNKTEKVTLLLFISFLFTSATFEPDFGSWIRHEAVTIPLIFILNHIATTSKINGEQKNENKMVY